MNPRGYTGAAQAHVGLGQLDEAIAILQLGLDVLPDNADILNMLEELQDDSELIALAEEILREILALIETEDIFAGNELFRANRNIFRDVSRDEPFKYLPQGETGRGVGVYSGRLYHGDYVNSKRHGFGTFISRWVDDEYQLFEGNWLYDMPNGRGVVTITTPHMTIIREGELINGLWNGIINGQYINEDGVEDGRELNTFFEGRAIDRRHFSLSGGEWIEGNVIWQERETTSGVPPFADSF